MKIQRCYEAFGKSLNVLIFTLSRLKLPFLLHWTEHEDENVREFGQFSLGNQRKVKEFLRQSPLVTLF